MWYFRSGYINDLLNELQRLFLSHSFCILTVCFLFWLFFPYRAECFIEPSTIWYRAYPEWQHQSICVGKLFFMLHLSKLNHYPDYSTKFVKFYWSFLTAFLILKFLKHLSFIHYLFTYKYHMHFPNYRKKKKKRNCFLAMLRSLEIHPHIYKYMNSL